MTKSQYDTDALRLAAPGPENGEDDLAPVLNEEQRDLDDLCERYAQWRQTRRYYAPQPSMGSVLGQLSGSSSSRPMKAGGPDAISSAELAAVHLAYTCQPDEVDKKAFALYYIHRVKPIKAAAAALSISRPRFYVVLAEFRKRLYSAAQSVMEQEQARLKDMQHSRAARDAYVFRSLLDSGGD